MNSPQANSDLAAFLMGDANVFPTNGSSHPFAAATTTTSDSTASTISVTIADSTSAHADHSPQAIEGGSTTTNLDFDALYLAMTNGGSRAETVVNMVEWLAKALPGVSVRCGLGTSRLRRLFDARLGWLGAESNLQRELAAKWSEFSDGGAKSSLNDTQITIRLGRPGLTRFAVLRLSGDRANNAVFEQLRQHEGVLSAILWSRPALAMPEWSVTRGRPRIAIGIAGIMALLLLIWPVHYRAACTVRVEPIGARVISAPFAATLESVFVEPGDEVVMGQPLVVLDGRPLRLERQSLDAEIQQSTKQHDVAIAADKIADAQLAHYKCQQLRRQRELIERRLGQLDIRSPIDGVVVVGDLRRSIGIPLEIGQVLFEIAPLDRVIVEVEIPEREIGLVKEDSAVRLRVDSARVGTHHTVLSQIYPSAQLREDQSVFIAPLEIDNQSRQYRPGMRGKATTYGPIRPWAWSYLRGVFEQATWLLGL